MTRPLRSVRSRVLTGLTAVALIAGSVTACSSDDPAPVATPAPSAGEATDPSTQDPARSDPVEDSLYPEVGDPGVDALHYDLVLAWDPTTSVLTGEQTLTFRSTQDAETFQLDLSDALTVSEVRVDGDTADFTHTGKDLVVETATTTDAEHVVEIDYAGTPEATEAPTRRADFTTTGWHITDTGETWTMQEPYGAHTWYAVNDHPSDKALYDLDISVPSPWVGVAGGTLVERSEDAGTTRTTWKMTDPAAAYLVTVAIGEFTMTEDRSASGVPITYWTSPKKPQQLTRLRKTAGALDWLEAKLGPYPFDTAGVVVVDSDSGMETQTMITLGDTAYLTSEAVILHELAHHWYGNQVTPDDWRDLWMNEGMAMYLQGVWEAEDTDFPIDTVMDGWAPYEASLRSEAGPPGDYDPQQFGASNVYYGPALMWHALRKRIGDERFWAMVRAWPASQDNATSNREEYLAWVEEQTGEELSDFFDEWLLGTKTPDRG